MSSSSQCMNTAPLAWERATLRLAPMLFSPAGRRMCFTVSRRASAASADAASTATAVEVVVESSTTIASILPA